LIYLLQRLWGWLKNIKVGELFIIALSVVAGLTIGRMINQRQVGSPRTEIIRDTICITQTDTVVRFLDRLLLVDSPPTIIQPVEYNLDTTQFMRVYKILQGKDIAVYTSRNIYRFKYARRYALYLYPDVTIQYKRFPQVTWSGVYIGYHDGVIIGTGISISRLDMFFDIGQKGVSFRVTFRLL